MNAVIGIHLDDYDRSVEVNDFELKFLSTDLAQRIRYSRTRQPNLNLVSRLLQPLDDVFDYIEFAEPNEKA